MLGTFLVSDSNMQQTAGHDAATVKRTRVVEALSADSVGKQVRLCGWVRTRRDSKAGFSFIDLNDGSSLKGVQVLAENKLANYESEILKAGIGSSIELVGQVVASPAKGQPTEVKAESIRI